MMDDQVPLRWQLLMEAVTQALVDWRGEHPQATLTEIEQALDARLAPTRAQMLTDLAHATPLDPPTVPPSCPTCHLVLHKRGTRRRQLRTHDQQLLLLDRDYLVCPGCGHGLFPPR